MSTGVYPMKQLERNTVLRQSGVALVAEWRCFVVIRWRHVGFRESRSTGAPVRRSASGPGPGRAGRSQARTHGIRRPEGNRHDGRPCVPGQRSGGIRPDSGPTTYVGPGTREFPSLLLRQRQTMARGKAGARVSVRGRQGHVPDLTRVQRSLDAFHTDADRAGRAVVQLQSCLVVGQ